MNYHLFVVQVFNKLCMYLSCRKIGQETELTTITDNDSTNPCRKPVCSVTLNSPGASGVSRILEFVMKTSSPSVEDTSEVNTELAVCYK